MVAEDNKEIKKKGDGKAVNGVDEKELHDRDTGCSQRNNESRELIQYAFALCSVHRHDVSKMHHSLVTPSED